MLVTLCVFRLVLTGTHIQTGKQERWYIILLEQNHLHFLHTFHKETLNCASCIICWWLLDYFIYAKLLVITTLPETSTDQWHVVCIHILIWETRSCFYVCVCYQKIWRLVICICSTNTFTVSVYHIDPGTILYTVSNW